MKKVFREMKHVRTKYFATIGRTGAQPGPVSARCDSFRPEGKESPQPKQKIKKEKREVPAGVPVLWRQPSDIARRDLYWGPGGESLQPDLRKVTLIKKEKGGLFHQVSSAGCVGPRVGSEDRQGG